MRGLFGAFNSRAPDESIVGMMVHHIVIRGKLRAWALDVMVCRHARAQPRTPRTTTHLSRASPHSSAETASTLRMPSQELALEAEWEAA